MAGVAIASLIFPHGKMMWLCGEKQVSGGHPTEVCSRGQFCHHIMVPEMPHKGVRWMCSHSLVLRSHSLPFEWQCGVFPGSCWWEADFQQWLSNGDKWSPIWPDFGQSVPPWVLEIAPLRCEVDVQPFTYIKEPGTAF